MEDKKLNVNESLEIISTMIETTRQRLNLVDGKLLLIWGYTSVAVSLLVTLMLIITRHPASNWLWFLIWIIGGSATAYIEKKRKIVTLSKTYIDKITFGLWSLIGYSAILCTFICLFLMLFMAKDCWVLMLFFALFGVGFAIAVQGIIFKEKSMIIGGAISILSGLIIAACVISGIELYLTWSMPLIILSFVCMFIIPGHIINHKAKVLA